jgi:hypothetical protein
MPDLLLLDEIAQLEHLLAVQPQLLERARPITSDLVVATRLEELGVPFLDVWKLIDGAEIAHNRARVNDLVARWWGTDAAVVEYRGRNLNTAAAVELREPLEICLNARLVYDRALDAVAPRRLHACFLPTVPLRRCGPAPLIRASLSLAQTVLRWCVARRGIPVHRLANPSALSSEERGGPRAGAVPPPDRPDVLRAWLAPEVPGHVSWTGPRPDLQRLRSAARLALLVENGQNPHELAHLEEALRRQPGWEVVRLIASVESPCRAWPWHLRRLRQRILRAQGAFRAWCESCSAEHPEIFHNPGMWPQFRSIWNDLLRAVGLGESFAALLDLLRPAFALFGFASFTLERVLLWTAAERGVPSVGLLHTGLIQSNDPLTLAADERHLLVWGQADVHHLARRSLGSELRQVGSLRYWQQYRDWAAGRVGGLAHELTRGAARAALGVPADRPVVLLLTAAVNSGLCLAMADESRHRASWRELLDFMARRQDLTFVLKPHPNFDLFLFYRHIARKAPPNLHLCWDNGLATVLPAGDVAVLINVCTTAALEAILARLPVVCLRAASYRSWLHHDALETGGAVNVASVADLESVVDRLLRDEDFRQQVAADAGVLVEHVLGPPSPPAPERVVERLTEIAAAPPAPGGATTFQADFHEVVNRLTGTDRESFLAAWARFVAAHGGGRVGVAGLRQVLFSLSIELGRAVPDAEQLLQLTDRCRRIARPLALRPRDYRGFVVNACLTALSWHAHPAESPAALRLVAEVRRLSPRAVLHSSQGMELLQRLGPTAAAAGPPSREEELDARIRSLEWEVAGLRASWTWKLGRLLVGPLGRVKRLLTRGRLA